MKKNLKKFIQGFLIGYLIICILAIALYLAVAGAILLFTWDLHTVALVEWNSGWLVLDSLKTINGISVIIGIIAGFINLGTDD